MQHQQFWTFDRKTKAAILSHCEGYEPLEMPGSNGPRWPKDMIIIDDTHTYMHTHIIYTHCVYAYYDILCSKCILVAKYCKIPCDMNSSNTNMLQIPWKMRGSNSKMLQNTVEMAAPSSKMLQTARETDRTGDQKKTSKAEHSHNSQNNFNSRPIYKYIDHFNTLFIIHATSDDYI